MTRIYQHIEYEDAPTLADYLGISLTNYYAKRSGIRFFHYKDVNRLVERYGSEADQEDLRLFLQLRDGLFTWLEASPIPLRSWAQSLGQKSIHALIYRNQQPEAWTLSELAIIGTFLNDFGKL